MKTIPRDTPSNHVGCNKPVLSHVEGRSALHRMFAFRIYSAMPVGYCADSNANGNFIKQKTFFITHNNIRLSWTELTME